MELFGLPGTLLLTLRARALEAARPDAILADPLAAAWLAQLAPAPDFQPVVDAAVTPVFQLGTAVRAHLYDQLTARFLAAHPDPLVVELGAGLSTRYQRLGAGRARWVELDLPAAIAARRMVDAETADHRYLACSMADPAWPAQLPPADPAQTLFLAEGVLFFLPETAVGALCRLLTTHFRGATFGLDVLTRQFSPKTRAAFAAAGIPFQWLVADTAALAPLGLTLQASWTVTQRFPERWQALGFDPARLPDGQGNVVVEARVTT